MMSFNAEPSRPLTRLRQSRIAWPEYLALRVETCAMRYDHDLSPAEQDVLRCSCLQLLWYVMHPAGILEKWESSLLFSYGSNHHQKDLP